MQQKPSLMTNGASHAEHALATPASITSDLLEKHATPASAFRWVALLCTVLVVLGVVGVVLRMSDGVSDKTVWGYYAALFVFILSTAQAAPMVAIATRLAKGHWRRPISRIAEMFTAVGVLNLLLFIPLLWVLPSLEDGRRSLWFFGNRDIPGYGYAPHLWATLALLFLVIGGIAMLWVSCLPDLAAIRDHSTGRRQRIARRMARGWQGTTRQWEMLDRRVGILGAYYFMMLVFVHFLISVDFAIALVPGWIDALFPATQAFTSLQGGAATVLLTMIVLRKAGYREYIELDQFWSLGKLLMAMSLLWFWFWFSSFNILWYGRKPNEQAVLDLFITGPYFWMFITTFMLNFVVPFFLMIWNPIRKSIWGPTLVASGVLIGTLLDRVRIYVAAFSIPGEDAAAHLLEQSPETVTPELADILIWAGGLGGVVLVFMLVARLVPVISIWEQTELLLYKVHKKFHRTEVLVLGKPE
jgi:hypothetical protein